MAVLRNLGKMNSLTSRLLAMEIPQISLHGVAEPVEVLHRQRQIEAECRAQFLAGRFGGHRPEQSAGDVARCQMHHQEDDDRYPEQNRDDRRQPSQDEPRHGQSSGRGRRRRARPSASAPARASFIAQRLPGARSLKSLRHRVCRAAQIHRGARLGLHPILLRGWPGICFNHSSGEKMRRLPRRPGRATANKCGA